MVSKNTNCDSDGKIISCIINKSQWENGAPQRMFENKNSAGINHQEHLHESHFIIVIINCKKEAL